MQKKRTLLIRERKKRKLTQFEAADLIKIGRSSYACYEAGIRNPGIQNAIKISNFYNIDIKRLR